MPEIILMQISHFRAHKSSNSTQWTTSNGGQGGQKLRVDLSLHIGEDKAYYKVESI